MIKSFKIRLYPTKSQEQLMWKHIGACRFIWNYMLETQQKNHEQGGRYLSGYDMVKMLSTLKTSRAHGWLYEVSNASLRQVCIDVDTAYRRFFHKTSGYPKFKSRKHSKLAFPICADKFYLADSQRAQIQKLGRVKYKTDFDLPLGRGVKFINPRISYVNGKWMLSFCIECESQAPVLNDFSMGIDLGVKETMVVAYDDRQMVFHNINKSKKMRSLEAKKRRLQRNISRKYEANKVGNKYVKTNNIIRMEDKLRQVCAKQTNIRHNYIHQSTHKLVSLLPRQVIMEDLNVAGMMKNQHLARAIQEQCFSEIYRQMRYKCEWNGIEFVTADRFYPSSKTCSNCGCIHSGLKLRDRTFICPECGFTIDRDYQAALNLMRYTA